ncbi:winged helix DNA-binding domain-containing protein [Corynebacterium nuruki]|uniref:winged helix DNA-binding domain-containing protein n=1 Tax=Corynebacterium nuruki TaxID=1032851 RepID=UPI0026576584|nr:winged helix DNA-binding domain-containing protein [Corynebacterium nuruki]
MTSQTPSVTTDQVIAFRLRNHGLLDRAPVTELEQVVGACGIQDSPPGSTALALHARTALTPDDLSDAVGTRKSLVTTWAMRGAPFLVPTEDAAVFTTGVLPPTETGRLHLIRGVERDLDRLNLTLDEATGLVREEIRGVLAGRQLTVTELGEEIAPGIAGHLPEDARGVWDSEGPHAAGQPVGEAVVHFVLRILTLDGVICMVPGRGSRFSLVDDWCGAPFPTVEPTAARAELLRRYLHCYGPSTRADFASWLGVTATDAKAWWNLLTDDLTEVDHAGRRSWALTTDLDGLLGDATFPGDAVRFLPPRDPYMQCRDRGTLVAKEYHRRVWAPVGAPGTILVGGRIAGVWRPKKSGTSLTVRVSPFRSLPPSTVEALAQEAESLGPFRGADRVTLAVRTPGAAATTASSA